jgi:Protein of unknown function (DUF3460)
MYVSEITDFLQDLKEKNPQIAVDQKKGRAIWWDKKPQTPEELEHLSQSQVRQAGYVYQTKL